MRVDDHGSHKGRRSSQLKQRVQASLLCKPCTLSWQLDLTGGNLTWRQNLPGHENLNVFLLIKTFTCRSWFKSHRNRRMAEANLLSCDGNGGVRLFSPAEQRLTGGRSAPNPRNTAAPLGLINIICILFKGDTLLSS